MDVESTNQISNGIFSLHVNNKKHIVLLIPGFPKDEEDYLCVPPVQLLLQHLDRSLFEISIIAFQYPYSPSNYEWHGYKISAIGGNNKKGVKRLITWRKVLKEFRRIHNNLAVDHIHSFWLTECAYMGAKLSKGYDIAHSCSLMGQEALKGNKYIKSMGTLPSLSVLSNYQQIQFRNTWNKEIQRVIPFGVEPQPVTNKPRIIDVLGVGSLIPLKQYDLFVLIVEELRKYGEVRVKLVGGGPEKPRLQRLIEEKNLEDTLELLGEQPREKVLELMKQSKVFLHTSTYESYGMVLNEALSCGARVLSTPVGMAHEHESIQTFRNIEDAVSLIRKNLETESFEPLSYYSLEDTVQAYTDWWLNG